MLYIHIYPIIKNPEPGLYDTLRHTDVSALSFFAEKKVVLSWFMNSNTVKPIEV